MIVKLESCKKSSLINEENNKKEKEIEKPKNEPPIFLDGKEFVCRRIFSTKSNTRLCTYRCKQSATCHTSFTIDDKKEIRKCKNFKHTCLMRNDREFSSNMNDKDYETIISYLKQNDENCLR